MDKDVNFFFARGFLEKARVVSFRGPKGFTISFEGSEYIFGLCSFIRSLLAVRGTYISYLPFFVKAIDFFGRDSRITIVVSIFRGLAVGSFRGFSSIESSKKETSPMIFFCFYKLTLFGDSRRLNGQKFCSLVGFLKPWWNLDIIWRYPLMSRNCFIRSWPFFIYGNGFPMQSATKNGEQRARILNEMWLITWDMCNSNFLSLTTKVFRYLTLCSKGEGVWGW